MKLHGSLWLLESMRTNRREDALNMNVETLPPM
jgi:hypothetical protein